MPRRAEAENSCSVVLGIWKLNSDMRVGSQEHLGSRRQGDQHETARNTFIIEPIEFKNRNWNC
jgi:hypothetical protein